MTLWERIDLNGLRRGGVAAVFLGLWSVAAALYSMAIAWAALIVHMFVSLVSADPLLSSGDLKWLFWACFAAVFAGFMLLGWYYLRWSQQVTSIDLVIRAGGRPAKAGEFGPTTRALHDMAVAAGMPSPRLFVMPGRRTVNAVVSGRTADRVVVGITEGFPVALTAEQQRAVFAHLMGRFRTGGLSWTSELAKLMWPVHAVEMSVQASGSALDGIGVPDEDKRGRWRDGTRLAAIMWPALRPLVAAFRGSYLCMSESADADGMMLLKDPKTMLDAYEVVRKFNNQMVCGDRLNYLAYVRPTHWKPEGWPELEHHRFHYLERLAGIETVGRLPAEPAGTFPDGPSAIDCSPEAEARRAAMRAVREESERRWDAMEERWRQIEAARRAGG